ncbi:MAG: YraN family protein, partial [Oligoflexia bacterium]|nr:YraN family protein [Oligoflexia bacterium]
MNPENKKIGNGGELHAGLWLCEKGHEIISRNFHKRVFEIDVITLCPAGIIHFVEVKTVEDGSVDDAVFSVHARNIGRYMTGVEAFVEEFPQYEDYPMSMDVVIVTRDDFLY